MKKRADRRRFWIGTVLLIVITVSGIVGAYQFERRIAKDCETSIQNATITKGKSLKNYFDTKVDFLNILTQFLDDDAELSAVELQQMTVIGEEMSASSLGFYDYVTNTCISDDEYVDKTFIENAWVDCLGNKKVILKSTSEKNGHDEIMLCVPWKKNGHILGMAFASFSMDNFIAKVSESVFDDNGYSVVIDGDGLVLIPSFAISRMDGRGNYIVEPQFQGAFEEQKFKEILRNADEGLNTCTSISIAAENCVASAVTLQGYSNIYVVSIVPENIAYGKSISLSNIIIIFFAVIALIIAVQGILYLRAKTKKKNEIEEAVNYDELTGLPTKPYHKQLATALIKKGDCNYAYAVFDVNGFKYINSSFGYEYGNEALKYIAHVIENSMTREETVSRTSGDHFAMLLKYDNADELVKRLDSLMARCADLPENSEGRSGKVVFRCGVYIINEPVEDINRIRARANVARKGIKKSMTHQIAFYSEEDFNKDIEVHELEGDLVNSIKNRELVVFLQPKYNIQQGKIKGAEALIRWQHPEKGMISPARFIPIAEVNGFVKDIDFFVFETVCKKLKEWEEEGKKLVTVSVNFSRLHLNDENFVGKLIKCAREHEVDPSLLEIELTETAVYDEMDKLLEIMYLIKEAGFGLSMDDFGSGYSSLHLLREMPVDVLKLDKGFLDDCGNNSPREKKVLSHVISMAKDLEISVLAEGVETESQKQFLEEANCDMIQGYYYAKPMSIADFEKYLADEQ
ncbi:MAG: EAL domain-containing protein [Lachnospiraceae bacterium]|nr:EAL domain-containing protein [Lachnospiraceae bacterium]